MPQIMVRSDLTVKFPIVNLDVTYIEFSYTRCGQNLDVFMLPHCVQFGLRQKSPG